MNNKFLNVPLYIWISFIVLSLVFIFIPEIDIYVSSLFYNGSIFPANKTWLEQLLYHSIKPVIISLSLLTAFIYAYNKITKKNVLNVSGRVVIFIFLTLSLAPGLIVNVFLKENWGRPRPNQTIEYGGNMHFTPAFIPTKQDGYSFSSGHTAAAFSLIGFALLASRRKKFWMSLVVTYGIAISIARMAAGGHFLSDVVTSFFIVYIATLILYGLIIKQKSSE